MGAGHVLSPPLHSAHSCRGVSREVTVCKAPGAPEEGPACPLRNQPPSGWGQVGKQPVGCRRAPQQRALLPVTPLPASQSWSQPCWGLGRNGEDHQGGPVPTYLDLIPPYFKGLSDADQEVFDLLEVTVADTPGPINQEDDVHGCGGRAVEWGAGWVGREGGEGLGQAPELLPTRLSTQDLPPWGWGKGVPGGFILRRGREPGLGEEGVLSCLGLARLKKPP